MNVNNHTLAKAAFVLSIPLLLGGCSVVHALGFGRPKSPMPEPRQALALSDASPGIAARSGATDDASGLSSIDAGRTALSAGDDSTAIAMFQRALTLGEDRAVALNGLGVAYARQGRTDLARQYFMIAIEADPSEPSYSRNLAKLLRDTAPVRAVAPASAAPRSASAEPVNLNPGIERVGRNEVRIRTAAASPTKAPAAVASHAGPLPTVRVAVQRNGRSALSAPAAGPASANPQAVQLAKAEPAAAPAPAPEPVRKGKAKVIDGFQQLARIEFSDIGSRTAKGNRAK